MLRYPSGNGHRAPHVALGDPTNNHTTTASTTDPTGSRGAGQGPTEVAGGPTCCGSRPTHNRAPLGRHLLDDQAPRGRAGRGGDPPEPGGGVPGVLHGLGDHGPPPPVCVPGAPPPPPPGLRRAPPNCEAPPPTGRLRPSIDRA